MSTHSVSSGPSLPRITVIGLGAMGTALAATFLNRGHSVTVWNRTREKADPLLGKGAQFAGTVAEALAASPLVVACVLDYAILRELLTPAAGALTGRVFVNLTTGSPRDARQMAAWVEQHGAEYLDGGIMATPTMIGQPESLIYYSGSEAAFRNYGDSLGVLGAAKYLGRDAGMASLTDMALLSVMYGVFSGFFHAVAFAGSEGIKAAELMPLIKPFLEAVASFLPMYVEQIDSGDYARGVVANLGMQAVSLGHIARASEEQGIRPDLLKPLLALFQQRAAAGFGQEDISGIIEIIKTPGR